MSGFATDRRATGRAPAAWLGGAVLALGALAVLAATPRAQPPADRPYPHGSFQGDCSLCHDPRAWLPAKPTKEFNHGKFGFPLAGAHVAAGCRACHATLDFAQQKTACVACHQDVHRGEMGGDCARCHTARSFVDRAAMVRGHQLTRFPLVGRHAGLDCETCHPSAPSGHMQFVGTRGECAGCHLGLYRAARDPDHAASGFPTDCSACHTPVQWTPARFGHAGTRFPLTGAHRRVACAGCHGDGVYRGKSADCYSCHRADYEATANPNHAAAGFPTGCGSCHNANGWQGATFDHDGRHFPIYSGRHAGRWSSCSTCHDAPNDFAQFTCFSCHPHDDRAGTDSRHSGVSGYRYDSQACYSCHRSGGGGD